MYSFGRRAYMGAVVAGAIGLASIAATKPAHADAWIQFGIVAPTLPPPAVVVPAPPPPPAYVYSPYGYAYPAPAYAVPTYSYRERRYVYGRYDWHDRRGRERDDWGDDD